MTHITLAHGNGGHFMRQLIEEVLAPILVNPILDINADAAQLPDLGNNLMMSTDSFTVKPLEFPGGNIGSLAVHGTLNDLAVCGARTRYLSLGMIIEEGLPLDQLIRLIKSLAQAAFTQDVMLACGDTKVVPRGEGSGLYLNTTGLGVRHSELVLGLHQIQPGDALLISGPIADHGTAVMLARDQFGLYSDVISDSDCVFPLCAALFDIPGLRFMRDPTRGGLATVLHEIHRSTGMGIRVQEQSIPVRESVKGVCDILGYDPLYLACEGRVLAVVAPQYAELALERWQAMEQGQEAHLIGLVDARGEHVIIETQIGGERIVSELQGDPLPRIC